MHNICNAKCLAYGIIGICKGENMVDINKTKDSHFKHNDFMNQYDKYNSEVTHCFDIATKQWLTNGDI